MYFNCFKSLKIYFIYTIYTLPSTLFTVLFLSPKPHQEANYNCIIEKNVSKACKKSNDSSHSYLGENALMKTKSKINTLTVNI